MTPILKRLVAISLSVIMALTLFPLIGGAFYGQTAFADDEIVQDDGDVGGGDVVNEEEPAPEALDENAPDGENPDEVVEEEAVEKDDVKAPKKDRDTSIYFEPEDESGNWDLYSDGYREYTVFANYEGVLVIRVGTGFVRDNEAETFEEWEAQFTGEVLNEGTYYSYDEDYGNLTLNGEPIYNKIHAAYNHVTVAVALIDDGTVSDDSLISASKSHDIAVKEPYVEYNVEWSEWDEIEGGWVGIDEPQGPITMLKGVDMAIYEDVEARVYNSNTPYGSNEDMCPVTNVTVSGDPVIEVSHDDEDWVLSPVELGEATVTVKIDGLDGEVTKEYDVTVSGERVVVDSIACKGHNDGVPGEFVEMRARAHYESMDYDDYDGLTFDWWIDANDTDVAQVMVDEEDSSKAIVKFKEVPLDGDYRYITVWVAATYVNEDGDIVIGRDASRDEVFLCAERYQITPSSEAVGLIDIGQSIEYTPQLYKIYYNGTLQRDLIEDAEFDVYLEYKGKYNKKKKKWTHKSWWATDHKNGTWTIKRYDGHWNDIEVSAYVDELDDWVYEYYYFDTIRTNLSKYQIKFVGAENYYGEPYYCIDDSNAGITPEIVVYDDYYAEYEEDAYVVPSDQYTVKVEKLNNKFKYVSSSMPLKFNKNEADPGSYNNGEAIYRVYVTAKKKNSHGFTKSTSKYNGIVLIYSDCTLTPVGGDVQLPNSFNQFKNKDLEGRYDLPLGVSLDPEDYIVTANAGNDTLSPSDYKVQYRDWRTKVLLDEFPTQTGKYDVVVTGQGAYYGLHDWNMLYIGQKNPVNVSTTTKTVKVKKLKKKAQTVAPLTVEDAVGDVTYSLSGNSKLKINKTTGKVTVKKKTKKGTYRAWVDVHANGDEIYAPEDTSILITIKVK